MGLSTVFRYMGGGKFSITAYQKIVILKQGDYLGKLAVHHLGSPFQEILYAGTPLHHAGDIIEGLEKIVYPYGLGVPFKYAGETKGNLVPPV
jgi:hypothetical protein